MQGQFCPHEQTDIALRLTIPVSGHQAAAIDGQLGTPMEVAAEQVVRIGGAEHRVRLDAVAGETLASVDGGKSIELIGRWSPGGRLFVGRIDEREIAVRIARDGRGWRLASGGASHRATVLAPHVAALTRHTIEKVPPDLSRFLFCPMPGLVTAINVAAGDAVEAGQPLAVIEAMKIENILRAEKAGRVKKVEAKTGESLAVDAVIIEFD